MLNSVTLVGNLGADPDVRYSAAGNAFARARIAVNDHGRDAGGEPTKKTYWFQILCFGKNAEVLANYTSKGSKIGVSGKLTVNEWEDSEGNKRYTTEIVVSQLELLSKASGDDNQGQRQSNGQSRSLQQGKGQQSQQEDDFPPPPEDDIPF
jgi:single-strand DNA-binding protein